MPLCVCISVSAERQRDGDGKLERMRSAFTSLCGRILQENVIPVMLPK